MRETTWRQRAAVIIHERYTSIRAAQADTVSDAAVLRMVSRDHYPWNGSHPYKAWLAAIKDYKIRLGVPVNKKNVKLDDLPLFQ